MILLLPIETGIRPYPRVQYPDTLEEDTRCRTGREAVDPMRGTHTLAAIAGEGGSAGESPEQSNEIVVQTDRK